ncbi:hypothetical protein D3C80_1226260 [compost metagenome]
MHDHAVVAGLDSFVLFVVANHHTAVPEVIRERIGHLLIEKRQQAVAGVNQINFDFHPTENGGVFAANDPCAVDQHMARLMMQAQNGVAVINARM